MEKVKIMHTTTKCFCQLNNSRNNRFFGCSSTVFKGKFTQNVENMRKNYTNFFLDCEKGLTQIKKGVNIQTCKLIYKNTIKIIIFNFSRKLN